MKKLYCFKVVPESSVWRSASQVLRPRPESLSAPGEALASNAAAPDPLLVPAQALAPAPRLPLRRTFADIDEVPAVPLPPEPADCSPVCCALRPCAQTQKRDRLEVKVMDG